MEEVLTNLMAWAFMVVIISGVLILTSRRSEDPERRRVIIPAFLLVLMMGYFLGWATSNENLPAAFAVFVSGAVLLWLYYRYLKRKGYVLEDERTLKIEEIASRRTLQATMLILASATIYLSIAQRGKPELRPAFELASGLLIVMLVIHWGLIHYYSRVM